MHKIPGQMWIALAALLVTVTAVAATEEVPWEKTQDKDGIEVWSRPAPEGRLPESRSRVVIDAPIEDVIAVLEDASSYTQWMYRCAESRLVATKEGNDRIAYNRTELPWPVSDRDSVLEVKVDYEKGDKEARITYETVTHPDVPEIDGVVRIPRMEGSYAIRELAPDRTEVISTLDTELGGSLPNWMIEIASSDQAYESLDGLRRMALKKKP